MLALEEQIHFIYVISVTSNTVVFASSAPKFCPGSSKEANTAGDICLSCLELAVTNFEHRKDYTGELASMVFPFLLVSPKVVFCHVISSKFDLVDVKFLWE